VAPWLLLVWTALGAPVPSTCAPPPIETQVSRASVIIDGTVERVVYLHPDGTPETEPRKAEPPRDATATLCGPKLIAFKVGQRLKGEAGETLTVFAEDGCFGLGSYYRAGEAFVEFAYKRTDSLNDTVMSRSTRFPGVAPADVTLHVHACGGTRRVRAADGTPVPDVGPDGHQAYVAEIRRLVGRLSPR
jgi:hypothetical protein